MMHAEITDGFANTAGQVIPVISAVVIERGKTRCANCGGSDLSGCSTVKGRAHCRKCVARIERERTKKRERVLEENRVAREHHAVMYRSTSWVNDAATAVDHEENSLCDANCPICGRQIPADRIACHRHFTIVMLRLMRKTA